ncbi:MAG: hypothetical protein V7L05_18935 [Nostoc sp.]
MRDACGGLRLRISTLSLERLEVLALLALYHQWQTSQLAWSKRKHLRWFICDRLASEACIY